MKHTLVFAIFSIFLFSACSSNNTPKTQYYLLNSPTSVTESNTGTKNSNKKSQDVTITLLELPDYLKQPNLVLQLSSHQLHYSNFHMWAEPLQRSIVHALAHDLNNFKSQYHFITPLTANEINTDTSLVVNISAFHVTHQSQAILVGSYWLQEESMKGKVTDNAFKLTVVLDDNGYPHAVEQMRKAVTQLADEIISNLPVK